MDERLADLDERLADAGIVRPEEWAARIPPTPRKRKWVEPADGLTTLTAPILVGWLIHLGWNRESIRAAPFGVLADFVQETLPGTVAEHVAGKLRGDADYRKRFRANGRTQRQVDKRLREFRKEWLPKLAGVRWRDR